VPFPEIAKRLRCQECGDKGALLTVRYDDPRRLTIAGMLRIWPLNPS
jgi:hypothetical protein